MPKEKMWVHTDDGASLSDSHKIEGHKSALARDEDNNLSQATMSEISDTEELEDAALVFAAGLAAAGLVWFGVEAWKRRKARKEEASEAVALVEEQDDVDALIEDTYAVIEDSKTVQSVKPQASSPEDDLDEDERQAVAKKALRRRAS
ncbi:hypothetical protein MWU57_08030 [Isoptericola sp. S6320L]|uniref:hypothetical protein n=1 Tax=Isoptericola sp. S6320L TaxID=2926411 RepID=UPI001FF13639|nr:hypothetical protein [Isoptericola sp. S6320L]MCK0116982.1 hypothetical protein [Isoptericola sp. S6320L]